MQPDPRVTSTPIQCTEAAMSLRPCPRASEIRAHLQAGHWPHACPAELRGHAASCRPCGDLVLLTQAFRATVLKRPPQPSCRHPACSGGAPSCVAAMQPFKASPGLCWGRRSSLSPLHCWWLWRLWFLRRGTACAGFLRRLNHPPSTSRLSGPVFRQARPSTPHSGLDCTGTHRI